MATTPCHFGRTCSRFDCSFYHPKGRSIDRANQQHFFSQSQHVMMPSHIAVNSYNYPPYQVPGIGNYNNYLSVVPGFSQGLPPYYSTDHERPSEDYESVPDEAPRDFEDDEGFGAECPCCLGKPFACENRDCASRGHCGCVFGQCQDNVEDDTWKDEWFAASRTCTCCEGYVYRCKVSDDACQSGTCFCAHTTSGSIQNGQAPPLTQTSTSTAQIAVSTTPSIPEASMISTASSTRSASCP